MEMAFACAKISKRAASVRTVGCHPPALDELVPVIAVGTEFARKDVAAATLVGRHPTADPTSVTRRTVVVTVSAPRVVAAARTAGLAPVAVWRSK